MSGVEPIPGSIVKAMCAVQTTMEAVKKSQRNQHGGYNFASTDDIYAALTRRMGEVGLSLIALEDECEIVRVEKQDKDGRTTAAQLARLVYSYVLATETDTWSHRNLRRSLYIQVTGPQTFQAAQSYTEKSIMRSLFKIPTGDMDLDSVSQGETEEDQAALNGQRKRKSSYAAKKDGTDALFNEINAKVVSAHSRDMLQQIRTLYAEEWESMPSRWHELLEHAYEDRMMSFGTPMAAE
jgi:hypothetical protein